MILNIKKGLWPEPVEFPTFYSVLTIQRVVRSTAGFYNEWEEVLIGMISRIRI